MIRHHPSPELLTDYASGAMQLSHSLGVATHLEMCDSCRRKLHHLTEIGSHYFSFSTPQTPVENDDDLKRKVLDLLDDEEHDEKVLETNSSDTEFSQSLKSILNKGYDSLDWSRVSPSIKVATLLHDKDGTQIALSRTQPGGKMPHHSHTGDEITVVLEGSFSDEEGLYSKGDFVFRNAKDRHSPVVTNDAECICLMVLDAPIQFTGFFTSWLNPLLRKHHAGP